MAHKTGEGAVFFAYHGGSTLLHRIPPAPKVLLMVALAAASFYVPPVPALCAWAALVVLSLAYLHFTPGEAACDNAPVMAYAVMLYAFSVILNLLSLREEGGMHEAADFLRALIPGTTYLPLFAHLALSIEVTSVFYRTTSSVQFSTAFRTVESALTRKDETPFADMLSLTLTFIPRLAQFWRRIDRAWRARGGKASVKRISVLVPVLFRVSMIEAYGKAMAEENRR